MDYKQEISILVVTHNHDRYIKKLIDSLEKFQYFNVYFCEAASSDSTLEILKTSIFKNNILVKTKLEGFSKNNNDLIRHFNLNTNFFLLINPDLYFEEDFIKTLYESSQKDPNIGIIAPEIHYPDNRLQVTWKKFPSIFQVFKKRLGFLKTIDEVQMKNNNIDWCIGACMLINKVLLKDNNTLLDERYRLYCEDVDICFEAHQRKLLVVGEKKAVAFHYLNELSSKKIFSKYNYWNIRSIIKFALKWNWKYFAKKSHKNI
ncbi:glycosyltransferase [Flavobacterium microcysteis]|uniref:Glycosyltransferase n=1 Tax=Flavobacterium microcysteis TaxID=2596891 RepID=A0A501QIK0_9FLAO|nr:glycosyltransferase [Flavobacterium microcysteis]TPD71961.1 glycosyltransferase [Flavobacterium microcysteis]